MTRLGYGPRRRRPGKATCTSQQLALEASSHDAQRRARRAPRPWLLGAPFDQPDGPCGARGDAEAAPEATGSVVLELPTRHLPRLEAAPVLADAAPCAHGRIVLGYVPRRQHLGMYAVPYEAAQGWAAAGTAAAYGRSIALALQSVRHVDEPGLVAPPQGVQCLTQAHL